MKRSTKEKILSYLEGQDWISGTELESCSDIWKTKASTVSRRARELYEGGQIDRKLVKGCVWYKKRPTQERLNDVANLWADSLGSTHHLKSPNQLFETAPPRFTMDPLTKKAK